MCFVVEQNTFGIIVMGLEIFGGGNIKYIFVACVISYVFSGKSGIYTSQKNITIE